MGKINAAWRVAMATMGQNFTKDEQAAGWPETLKHWQLAALQYPHIKGETAKIRLARARANDIADACKSGVLPHTATTVTVTPKPLQVQRQTRFASSEWLMRDGFISARPTQRTPQPYDVTTYTITASDFAAWLAAQPETASEHIAAWFDAVGANTQPSDLPVVAREIGFTKSSQLIDGVGKTGGGLSQFKFQKAMRTIADVFLPELTAWPKQFPPECLARLQSSPDNSTDAEAWQKAIESDVSGGVLASEIRPYSLSPIVWDLSRNYEDQLIACTRPAITAQAFAAWLAAQQENPSQHIAAWFEALGVNSESESTPAPTATPLLEQPTLWTDKRKREARAMLLKLKGKGVRAFHKQTAEHYQVSPQRLRDVLNDSVQPTSKKAPGQNSVFDVPTTKVNRIK